MFVVHDTTKDHTNAPRTGLQPVVMLVFEGCAATGSCQSGGAYAATMSIGNVQAQAAARGHI